MKKVFKSAIGLLLLVTVFSGSMVLSVNAETIFEDSFEIGLTDDIEAGIPDLKVYGENLVANGGFETGDKGSFAGVGLLTSDLFQVKPYASRSVGGYGADYAGGAANNWGYGIKYPLSGSRTEITKGLYEIEAWVKIRNTEDIGSHVSISCDTRSISADADGTVSADNVVDTYWKLNRSYCISSPVYLNASWQKLSGYMVFTDTPDVNAENLSIFFSFIKKNDDAQGFYLDDVSMRKIENVDIMDNADMPFAHTSITNQTNVPYSKLSLAAGKTGTVNYPIYNNTRSYKEITLIAALFNADTRFNKVLDSRKVNVAPGYSNVTADMEIPDYITDSHSLQYFIWDNLDNLMPYTDYFENSNTAFKTNASFAIPNSNGWKSSSIHPTDGSLVYAYPEYLDMISSLGSSSSLSVSVTPKGVNSLYLPFAAAVDNSTIVYKDIANLEANTTYTLSFDICSVRQCADPCTFAVTKGSADALAGSSADAAKMLSLSPLDKSGFTTYEDQGLDGGVWTRIYQAPVGWNKISYTFTTTDEGTYSIAFRKAYSGYKTQSTSTVFGGCYIDNVSITK